MELMGAPQVTVELGGMRLLIRGRRPGESPAPNSQPMQQFEGFVSHNGWGTDHFGYEYEGDLLAFCEEIRAKGATSPPNRGNSSPVTRSASCRRPTTSPSS